LKQNISYYDVSIVRQIAVALSDDECQMTVER
jgi:hypothetical protein